MPERERQSSAELAAAADDLEALKTVARRGPKQLVRLVERQRAHAPVMARTTVAQRRERLRRLGAAIAARRQDILRALYADLRRPPAESELAEIHNSLQEIAFAVRHLKRWMRPQRVRTPALLFGTFSRLRFEPRGTVLILAPWNYPFSLAINPLVAAIAAGNCAVVKPSEKAPATARLVASLIGAACDEREVAVVEGGPEVAKALLELRFDHFFFTGGAAVGKLVMAAAAKHLASVTLELGGKSPAVVDQSANVVAAAQRIAWGKFLNAGQTCTAPDYVLVHGAVANDFLTALKATIERFYGSDPAARRTSPDFARLIDDAHFRRVVDLTERTVAGGARIEIGGEWDAPTRYVAPTVLSDVAVTAPVMEQEIFGPVLPVLTYRELSEAIGVMRQHGKPLASYVFSGDRRVVNEVLSSVPAGGTTVNNTLLHYGSAELPFGGVGESGIGSYHGYHGFLAMSHARPVLRQREPALTRLFFPPYRGRLHALARRVLRWLE